jgi:thiazole synthase
MANGQSDPLMIADKSFGSRLLIGSTTYPNSQIMLDSIRASGAEIVTVAIRRISLQGGAETIVDLLSGEFHILPNTAGCYTARDAVLTAKLAREALETNWLKLEVIGDRETLYPDAEHLLQAADELVEEGFIVMPYCTDDPILCRKLEDIGCAAIMPLGSPIGSGMGIVNPYNLEIIRAQTEVPLIVDAGIGTASDAALAMELGCDGVMLASAVAKAHDPVGMANAMRHAIEGGRLAHLSGRIPRKRHAEASSPERGVIGT